MALIFMIGATACMHRYPAENMEEESLPSVSVEEPQEEPEEEPIILHVYPAETEKILAAEAVPAEQTDQVLQAFTARIYGLNEEYHFFQQVGNNVQDLYIAVTDFAEGGISLPVEFEETDEETLTGYICEEGERLVFYTLSLRAGEKHDPVDFGGLTQALVAQGLKTVVKNEDEYVLRELTLMDGLFTPMDFPGDTNKYFVQLEPGQARQFTFAVKVREEDLDKPMYLYVSPSGWVAYGGSTWDPDELTEEEKAMHAFVRLR